MIRSQIEAGPGFGQPVEMLPLKGTPLLDDAKTEYYSWLIIPLRVCDALRKNTYFRKLPKYKLELEDLTIQARGMFGEEETAIGACWRFDAETIGKEALGINPSEPLTVENRSFREGSFSFQVETSWMFCFHSDIAFFCLGLMHDNPLVAQMVSDFGFLEQSAVVRQGETRLPFQQGIYDWLFQKVGYLPFFGKEGEERGWEHLFVDVCLYNLALREERFPDIEPVRKAVHNLHLGLRVNDPRTDESEEDIAFVYSVKNLEVDTPSHPGEGSYRWGCCVTSQTLNYIYGGFAPRLSQKKEAIDQILMEGLPLMIIALQQRYHCFKLIEQMNRFGSLGSAQREKLRETVTKFIAYDTLSPAAISRWYNVKQVYYHLIDLLETDSSIEDVTKKLNMLIEESERQAQQAIENTNRMVTLFGAVAIPASAIQIIQLFMGEAPLWQKGCTVLFFLLVAGMFLRGRKS